MARWAGLLICIATGAHAEPRVKTELTLQRGKAKATRMLVRDVDAQELSNAKPCTLGLTITPQHAEFRSFDLHFSYDTARTIPIRLDIAVARGTDHLTVNGQLVLKPRRGALVATITSGFDHAAAHWTLRGRIDVDDLTCGADAK